LEPQIHRGVRGEFGEEEERKSDVSCGVYNGVLLKKKERGSCQNRRKKNALKKPEKRENSLSLLVMEYGSRRRGTDASPKRQN